MSYIDDLNQAATEALAASSSATESAQIMFDVANGGDTAVVSTAGGDVDAIAKAIKDIKDSLINGSLASEIEEQTLSAGQTTVVMTSLELVSRPVVFIEGSFEDDFTVTSPTEIELGSSFPDGTRIWILQNVVLDSGNIPATVEEHQILIWQGIA